ncbi:hypothetical protein H0H92_002780 [Tricholoma furcatifolium]|nr:hypothetical protein H0H92_002780 [Tricholoma furcatifolium]
MAETIPQAPLIPAITPSPLVGNTNAPGNIFNDLEEYGITPNDIVKISKVKVLWLVEDSPHPLPYVSGLRLSYIIRDGGLTRAIDVNHGRGAPGPDIPLVLGGKEFVAGMVGEVEGASVAEGTLRRVALLVYDTNGSLTEYRPAPPLGSEIPPHVETKGFGFLGLTYAFGGIEWGSTGTTPAIRIFYRPGMVAPTNL